MNTTKELTSEEKELLQKKQAALDLLKNHPATKMWITSCEKSHTMDIPLMVVDVIYELNEENKKLRDQVGNKP